MDFKIKIVFAVNNTVNKVKTQPTEWEKIQDIQQNV